MRRYFVASAAMLVASATLAETTKIEEAKTLFGKAADACDTLKDHEIAACYQALSAGLVERAKKTLAEMSSPAKQAASPPPTLPVSNPTKLSGADLAVQTHKWDGKIVQARANCFYADKNEYRCLVVDGPRVDFETLQPDSARDRIESKCDTIQKMTTKACVVTIQFTYGGYDQQDTGGLGRLRLVIAKDNTGYILER